MLFLRAIEEASLEKASGTSISMILSLKTLSIVSKSDGVRSFFKGTLAEPLYGRWCMLASLKHLKELNFEVLLRSGL